MHPPLLSFCPGEAPAPAPRHQTPPPPPSARWDGRIPPPVPSSAPAWLLPQRRPRPSAPPRGIGCERRLCTPSACGQATLALVEPYHAVAISTVQGEGKDWHAGWYAALAVLLTRAAVLEAAGGEEGEGSVCGAPVHAPGRLRAGGRRRRGGVRQRGRSSRGEGEGRARRQKGRRRGGPSLTLLPIFPAEPRGGGEDEGGACFAVARRARVAVRLRAARGGPCCGGEVVGA